MTEQEYEAGRARALGILTRRGYTLAMAEDAVQAAALYFLEHTYPRVTPSLFTQRAAQRARDLTEAAYGSKRAHGKARLIIFVGNTADILDSPVCRSEADE